MFSITVTTKGVIAALRLLRRPGDASVRFSACLKYFPLYMLTKFDSTAIRQLTANNRFNTLARWEEHNNMRYQILIDGRIYIEHQNCASFVIVQSCRLQFGLEDYWIGPVDSEMGILWPIGRSCRFQIRVFMAHWTYGFPLTSFLRCRRYK